MIKQPIVSDPSISPTALKSLESYVKKSTIENFHTWYELKEKEVNHFLIYSLKFQQLKF